MVCAAGELRHLDDEADGAGGALRRMRHAGRQQEQLALFDRHVARLAVVDDLQNDVALDLVEQLAAGVDVVVAALVRPADDHDEEVAVPDGLVPDRRLQEVAVLRDPGAQVDRREHGHGSPPR